MVEQLRVSAREFLELPETMTPTELIEGEIIVAPAPLDRHQEILGEIHVVLRQIIPSGKVRLAPTDLYLDDANVVQPDLFWVSDANTHCALVDGRFWRGAPDLIVEILSPSTSRRDRDVKFRLYEMHGVREYWLVEAEAAFLEVYTLHDGKFARLGFFGVGESFASPALSGAEINVDALLK